MKKPPATVSAPFVDAFLQTTGIDSETRDRLVRHAGIVPVLRGQPAARVTEEQFAALYRSLVAHLDDEMPGILSRPLRRGSTKFLCLSLLDAPSLQAALQRYTRFHHMILDDFELALERGPDNTALAIVPVRGCAPPTVLAQQLLFKFVHSLASWLTGRSLPVLQVRFAFASPADGLDHGCLYPGPVAFDAARSELRFPSALMDAPLARRGSEDVRRFLARAPAGWIFTTATTMSVAQRVRDYLEHPAAPRDIVSVAEALHYSVRTLCRRLEAEGTSFRLIKDELRRDLAVQRLTRTSRSIAAIAFELGFEDSTAFYRAFKHWTGSTPGAYRRAYSKPADAGADEPIDGGQEAAPTAG